MKKDLIQTIDKAYYAFENLAYDKNAKQLFIKYLLGEKIEDETDEIKLKISFKGLTKSAIISEIAKYALICSCNNKEVFLNENYDDFKNALLESKVKYDEVYNYLFDNREMLYNIIDTFVEQRYNNHIYQMTNREINDEEVSKYIDNLEPSGKSDEKPPVLSSISSLLFNKSRKDVLNNSQFTVNHKSYSLDGDLFATIDRGNKGLTQEDSVVIIDHPSNKRFKMIAVADGDSFKANGELASNYVLKSLVKWFEELKVYYYNYITDLKPLLEKELKKIDVNIKYELNDGFSTIALAIIGEYNTIISSIGDTRLYVIKNNKIVKKTKDDSYVETLCDNGLAKREIASFHKSTNFVNDEIGCVRHKEVFSKNTELVPNDDYDQILIMSDGGARLISDDKIETIVKYTDIENTTEKLVKKATTEDIYLDEIEPWHNQVVKAGQNNVTVAMYVKRR